jgi:ABC-type sugar transport system substrate-binding protein
MKRTLAVAAAMLALAGAAVAATTRTVGLPAYPGAESGLPNHYPAPKNKGVKFTVGFLNPTASNESLNALQSGVALMTRKLGGTFIAKDDQLKVDKQVSDFQQLLAQKVDAIVVYPLDPRALRPSLAQAAKAGVPVVGIDVTFGGAAAPPGYATQVQEGRDRQAFLMVQELKQARPGAHLGIIGIAAPVPGLQYLKVREIYWAKQAGLKVLGSQDDGTDEPSGGQQAMTGLLGKFADMDGTLVYDDGPALGAAAAAQSSGRKVTIVSLGGSSGGLNGVKTGKLYATQQVDMVGIGMQAGTAAYDLITKQGLPLPRVVVRPPTPYFKSNVGTARTWAQQLKALGG